MKTNRNQTPATLALCQAQSPRGTNIPARLRSVSVPSGRPLKGYEHLYVTDYVGIVRTLARHVLGACDARYLM